MSSTTTLRLAAACLSIGLVQCTPPADPDPAPDPTEPSLSEAPPEPVVDEYSIVVCGHLYSLYVRNKMMSRKELVHTEAHLETFAEELRRIEPRATFFLGDNTRFASEDEWAMLSRVFDGVGGQQVWVAGNHDHREIETFEQAGGVRWGSFVIGRNKFVVFDSKTVFDETDLSFVERELADHESYDHVFVMMHYTLITTEEADEETDPFKPYSGKSNWNSAVVPLIAGKVDYVFVGDYYPGHVGRLVQRFGDHDVQYIRNAFLFRRGRGDDKTGDGPMLFLELRFSGSDLEILPRALPVPVDDPWYRDFRVPAEFKEATFEEPKKASKRWSFHAVGRDFALPVPPTWEVRREGSGSLLSATDEGSGFELRVFAYPESADVDSLFESLSASAGLGPDEVEREGRLDLRSESGRWSLSRLFRGDGSGLNVVFTQGVTGYLITIALPERDQDYRQEITDRFLAFSVIEGIRFNP